MGSWRANLPLGARQILNWRVPTACQLCAICVRTCNNVRLHDLTRLPRPHVPQVFVCAPCNAPLSSWRTQTTATGARGWHAFAKSWGRFWGPHWEVHVKPGRRRIHLVCGESKPPTPDLELLAAAILWESRKNGDSFRKLQYSRAHSQWKCPWGTLMQVRKALSAPRVTEVHFQTDEDNDIFGAACNLWQKLEVFSPCTKAFPGDRSR